MKYFKMVAWVSVTGLILSMLPPGLIADAQQKGAEEKGTKPGTAASTPVYQPPKRGAPGGRVGGGTRGIQRDVFVLSVLAPDHSGFTTREQPSLYWFISSSTSYPVELTVMDPKDVQPILETTIPGPVQPGVHRVRLTDYGIKLKPGEAYRWFVAVVPDADRRSKDILAGGAVERIEMPDGLQAKLAKAQKGELPFIYAEAGIWYDALAAISELIEAAPNDPELRRQRAALLSQVGLPGVGEGQN